MGGVYSIPLYVSGGFPHYRRKRGIELK